ncbi:MAG: TIGR00645 family protein [Caulobacteraceae bacterium]|nr:TIGR00645 family protein [Caulobacteraceae bacterium]
MTKPKPVPEIWLERGLFASRWLMAPFYIGLVAGLVALLAVFVQELIHEIPLVVASGKADDAVVMALSLIDLSLGGNLLLIVILSGYENFVSKIDIGEHEDRPEWMGTLDFAGLKMKLIASIVAISAVALLKAFMALSEPGAEPDTAKLGWMVGLHLTFVVSGVMMALMDWIGAKSGH